MKFTKDKSMFGSLSWMEYVNGLFAFGILGGWDSDSGEE